MCRTSWEGQHSGQSSEALTDTTEKNLAVSSHDWVEDTNKQSPKMVPLGCLEGVIQAMLPHYLLYLVVKCTLPSFLSSALLEKCESGAWCSICYLVTDYQNKALTSLGILVMRVMSTVLQASMGISLHI